MVRNASEQRQDPHAKAGWAALRDGKWELARKRFDAATKTPETYEGLSWAAWWLDDAEAVFRARERAYRAYRKRGDPAAAARMATWLAVDQLDFHGAWAVASGWFARAGRLLEPLEDAPEHGWLAFHEGYIAHVQGDSVVARERAAFASEVGRRLAVPDLEMLGLALAGASHVAAAEVDAGMRCLDEATVAALEDDAEIPISGAWACCFLVSACTAVLDYERAAEWCDRIGAFAQRYGSRYMLAFCRAEYGAVLLSRGRWVEAEEQLTAAREDFARSRPAWAAGPTAVLAELLRRRGQTERASALLDGAGPTAAAQLCRARIALDDGDALRAAELAERVLRQIPPARALDRAPALELLVRSRVALGDLEEAASAAEAFGDVARSAGTPLFHAQAQTAEGMLAAAGGDHDRARRLLEDAVDGFDRGHAPFEAARARIELATALLALGRCEESTGEASDAMEQLRGLGADAEAARAEAIARAADASETEAPAVAVTRRERDVLRLLADGLTNRQIAEQLVVSEHTVHRHVANILRKLELPSRTAAAAFALRTGLLD